MNGGVQLSLGGLPLDPVELAKLPILERIALFEELGLSREQREAAEQACRLVIAQRYPTRRR